MRIMIDNIVYFAKVKKGAKIPTKSKENMGYDVYACLPDGINEIMIKPHETVLIPTGIASACSLKYGFVLKERGSTGTKGMEQRCGVIDSGYRNEWFVPITNGNNKPIIISDDTKGIHTDKNIYYPLSKAICQALLIEVPDVDVQELSYDELQRIESERGMGHLGSSGK